MPSFQIALTSLRGRFLPPAAGLVLSLVLGRVELSPQAPREMPATQRMFLAQGVAQQVSGLRAPKLPRSLRSSDSVLESPLAEMQQMQDVSVRPKPVPRFSTNWRN